MPFDNKTIDRLLETPTDAADLTTYRMATTPWPIVLPADMAAAIGSTFQRRRMTPFAGVAVDVISSKLEIDREKLKLAGATETKAVKQWLSDDSFAATERELWRTVVRDGKAYLLVNWKAIDESQPDYQEARPMFKVVPAYDGRSGAGCAHDPMTGMTAFSWNYWDDKEQEYFDVYFPDRIEKYVRNKDDKGSKDNYWGPREDAPGEGWPVAWASEDGKPLGIALIHFCLDGSDIADAIQLAKDLNDATIDMLAMSRTQGWPQRYLKGSRNSDVMTNGLGQPVISMHTGRPIKKELVLGPGSILQLTGDTEMGQLPAASPDPALIDKLLELLSFVTTVPTHYFTGEWPSGVAIQQAESRLNHKVEEHQSRLSQPMCAVIGIMMRLSNHFEKTKLKAQAKIVIEWMTPQVETDEVRFAREQANRDHATDLYAAGLMTLTTALKTIHPDWTDEQIEAEKAELEKAKAQAHEEAVALKVAQPDVQDGDGETVAGSDQTPPDKTK